MARRLAQFKIIGQSMFGQIWLSRDPAYEPCTASHALPIKRFKSTSWQERLILRRVSKNKNMKENEMKSKCDAMI